MTRGPGLDMGGATVGEVEVDRVCRPANPRMCETGTEPALPPHPEKMTGPGSGDAALAEVREVVVDGCAVRRSRGQRERREQCRRSERLVCPERTPHEQAAFLPVAW